MGGVNVHDAWEHGVMPYTTTGVFGKSSNVGTLMLAQRIGPQRYSDMLDKFGLGQRTGVGLPGESDGLVPPIDQWSGSTFSNLPIGQGLSMTLLQMTGMYQTIANDGVRIPPRIIKATIAADGTRTEEPRPGGRAGGVAGDRADRAQHVARRRCNATRRATSRAPARRLRSTATRSPARPAPRSRSTPAAAATTTTSTGSRSRAWRTTDDPRYVIGIMMDNPQRTADGHAGHYDGAAVPQHRRLAVAAGERAAVTRPGPAADTAGHLSRVGIQLARGRHRPRAGNRPGRAGTVSSP